MSELLSSVIGGGGVFVPTYISPLRIISSGSSGTILNLTPPVGERVELVMLYRFSTGADTDISIDFGGVDIITNGILSDGASAMGTGEFTVGARALASTTPPDSSNSIVGAVDQPLNIVKTTGVTGSNFKYLYRFGGVK